MVQHVRLDAELYNNNDGDQGRDARHKVGVGTARSISGHGPDAQSNDINVWPARIYSSLCAPASVIPVTTSRAVSPQSLMERFSHQAVPPDMFDMDVHCRDLPAPVRPAFPCAGAAKAGFRRVIGGSGAGGRATRS